MIQKKLVPLRFHRMARRLPVGMLVVQFCYGIGIRFVQMNKWPFIAIYNLSPNFSVAITFLSVLERARLHIFLSTHR